MSRVIYTSIYCRFIIVLFFILPVDVAFSQVKSKGIPFIHNYTKEEYDGSSQIWSITQDYKGIMFFANDNGIVAFDGTYWRKYHVSNNIAARTVKADNDGKLYTGGPNSAGYFSPDSAGRFSFHSILETSSPLPHDIGTVWNIFLLEDKTVIHSENGLYAISKDTVILYKSEQIYAKAFQVDEKIFITDLENGLQVLDGDSFISLPDAESFKNLYVTSLFDIGENKYLIATLRNGLFIYENERLEKWKTPAENFLKENQVFCGRKLSMRSSSTTFATENYFAFGTIRDGLLIINQNGTPVQHLNKNKGLQNNTILDIFRDANGNLWLALDNGIDYIELASPFTIFNDIIGFPGTIYALEFFKDKIYVGTNQGVFIKNRSDIEDVIDYNPEVSIVPKTEGQVWSFSKSNNNLLCCHHEGVFSIQDSKAKKLSFDPGAWIILPFRNNKNLIGEYNGVSVIDQSDIKRAIANPLKSFQKKIKGFEESARIIEIDDVDSSIWVAHGYQGIYHLFTDKNNDSIIDFKLYTSKHGLPADNFNSIFKIRGELVIGTRYGVYKKLPDKDTIVPHEFYSEYLGNRSHIRKMIEDEYGNIWISIEKNIGVMILQSDGSYKYETDQFKRIKNTLIGGFELIKILDKENIFFGANEGIIHYTPQITKDVDSPFSVLLRRVNFSGAKTIKAFSGYYSKENELAPKAKDEIPFSSNAVHFVYSATFFEDIKNNRYQIKLEGFDKEWSDWTTKTEKEYTNLHEGEYCFNVKAMNTYNKVSETTQFYFKILPPWYRSGIAYVIYIIFSILGIAILSFWIYLRFKNQRQTLQEEKRIEIEAQETQFKEKSDLADKEITKLQNEKLEAENARKNTELASFAMQITQKNEILNLLQRKLSNVSKNVNDNARMQLEDLVKQIQKESRQSDDAEKFEQYFNEVHNNFLTRLTEKHADLSPKEIKMCAYLRMNLSTKEIAPLLNITTGGVEKGRYRIRKKLNLAKEDNLLEYLLKF